MAESNGDKTEAPTPRRREEAREHGNIARSPDLTSAALLIGILMLLKSFGNTLVTSLRSIVHDTLDGSSMVSLDPVAAAEQLARALMAVGLAMLPMFAGIVVIAVVVNVAQVGLNFNVGRLSPNFAALNPTRGFSRIFGGTRALIQLGINFLKVVLVGMTAYSAVHGRLSQIVSVQSLGFVQIFGFGAQLVYSISLRIGILLFVLALLDYAYQRHRIEQELKMTKQEVKDEMRSMDGDPKIKQRRRQIAMQRHTQRLKKEVPKADVIITNPTHFAIALEYDSATMRAPRVLAKGGDFMAQRIREIAIEHGIPLLERPPLARAIYRMCDVGDEIPEEFYSAVAEILAYVFELSKKAKLLSA